MPKPTLATLLPTLFVLATTSAGCQSEPLESQKSQTSPPQPEPAPTAEPPSEATPTGETRLRTVYVPAYSHLPRGGDVRDHAMLSILLSVRNVDSRATITLSHVDYFDTSGHRVRRYLEAPRKLGPLETAEFKVPARDKAGGSGANFLIYWEGPSDAHPLLAESVMLAHMGAGHVSFTSRGVELNRRPDPALFEQTP